MEAINKRDSQIDALRGLAILCVLYIHVTADFAYADGRSLTYAVLNHVNKLFYIAVPTFIAITVYLGLKSGKRRGLGYCLSHGAPIAGLYILWSAVYTGLNCLNGAALPDVKTAVCSLLLQGGACYHLYYVVMLVQLYFVIALLSYLPIKKLKPRLWLLAAAIILQEAVLYAFMRLVVMRFWFYNTAIFPLFYLVPIMYGLMLAAGKDEASGMFRRFKWLFAALYALSIPLMAALYAHGGEIFGENYVAYSMTDTLFRLINLSGIPLLFLLAEKIKNFPPLSVLGRHSLTVYFAHPLVLTALDILGNFNSGSPYKLILGVAVKGLVLTALAFGFAYAAERIKRPKAY